MIINQFWSDPAQTAKVKKHTPYRLFSDQRNNNNGAWSRTYTTYSHHKGQGNTPKQMEYQNYNNNTFNVNTNTSTYFSGNSNNSNGTNNCKYFAWDFSENGNDDLPPINQWGGILGLNFSVAGIRGSHGTNYVNNTKGTLEFKPFVAAFDAANSPAWLGRDDNESSPWAPTYNPIWGDANISNFGNRHGYNDSSNNEIRGLPNYNSNNEVYAFRGNSGGGGSNAGIYGMDDAYNAGQVSNYKWKLNSSDVGINNGYDGGNSFAGNIQNEYWQNSNNSTYLNPQYHDPYKYYCTENDTMTDQTNGTSGGGPQSGMKGLSVERWGLSGLNDWTKAARSLGMSINFLGRGTINNSRHYISGLKASISYYKWGTSSSNVADSDGWFLGGLEGDTNDLVFGISEEQGGTFKSCSIPNFWETNKGKWVCVTARYSPGEFMQLYVQERGSITGFSQVTTTVPDHCQWVNGTRNCIIGRTSAKTYAYEPYCTSKFALGQMFIYNKTLGPNETIHNHKATRWRYE